ncbi:MAG: branched-chain amino acid ABC transporter ATP-binding protein [Deltaproteobacteria bacterium CG_4_8_14_3_um_filter_51_11]|nr:ABC transporter ATP-binding protein [bacterium]OIP39459.1 MAG: branched-chain amino acid ABC transporter ATP-binding protein [Desulfobacteraceae bacterium CG2_30_51_40]PIP46461.1 MAG: branched-chain amino acid ABC transporter ATP-binding protein [Deltaproteobacteria bacterium CG23_combo_of_CG06-09_8_20_14_all_51_20]PIX18390.1 MAG: branched-chain amino acid ABC transporter ATP-binding protein [Deltaproteobacteria bacterium CG_4_8_14_3_um_filter_51_11]PIY26212.1 MAG: branched-chain amino acid 
MSVFYDKAMLLNDVNLGVDEGELVSLVGPNGAGKSTLLRAITGLVARDREISKRSTGGEVILKGKIRFAGEEIQGVPAYQIVKRGLVHCPERRRPFREMAVRDNLLAGAYLKRDRVAKASDLEKVYTLFPVLKGRSSQVAGTLSGGEQQMLAIGRALMTEPKLLCIDEPSTGLAPILRKEVFTKIKEVSLLGITVLLVEQEVSAVFEMASRNYVLSSGRIIAEGTAESLLKDEVIRKTYLGL